MTHAVAAARLRHLPLQLLVHRAERVRVAGKQVWRRGADVHHLLSALCLTRLQPHAQLVEARLAAGSDHQLPAAGGEQHHLRVRGDQLTSSSKADYPKASDYHGYMSLGSEALSANKTVTFHVPKLSIDVQKKSSSS